VRIATALFFVSIAVAASPAFGQTFEVKLAPSPKNRGACSSGDSELAVTFAIAISGDSASVTSRNGITTIYKKVRDGVYEGTFRNLTGTLVVAERSLRVEQRNAGCAWEGKAI